MVKSMLGSGRSIGVVLVLLVGSLAVASPGHAQDEEDLAKKKIMIELARGGVEQEAWKKYEKTAEGFVSEWLEWLCASSERFGPGGTQTPLTQACKQRILCMVRAISWVESQHGMGAGNQPKRDPMQSGNPNDTWWKELTDSNVGTDRIVRGGDKTSYDIHEVPDVNDIPQGVRGTMTNDVKQNGHNSQDFTSEMSFGWGVIGFLRKINEVRTYHIPDSKCTCEELKAAAVRYNGGGDPLYSEKLDVALKTIGCCKD